MSIIPARSGATVSGVEIVEACVHKGVHHLFEGVKIHPLPLQRWGDRIHYDLCINTTQTNIKEMTAAVTRLFAAK